MGRRHFVLPDKASPTSQNGGETYAPKRPRLMAVADRLQHSVAESQGNSLNINSSVVPSQGMAQNCQEVEADDVSEESLDPLDNEWNNIDDHSENIQSPAEDETVLDTAQGGGVDIGEQKDINEAILDPTNGMAIDLLNLCNDAKIPLIYYDRLVGVIKKGAKQGVIWRRLPSRERLYKILTHRFPTNPPEMVVIPNTEDVVPKFSMKEQILDLLKGKYFCGTGAVTNCCVNPDDHDPFGRYMAPPDEGRVEVTSGSWYEDTYAEFIGDNPEFMDDISGLSYKNWLLPIIFYNDKTGVSAMEGSYSLEPLMFTLGIIRRTFRENPDAWRHVGFLPSFSGYQEDDDSRNTKKKKKSPEESLRFTHECMGILLQDLVDLQQTPPLVVIELFGKQYRLRLIMQVAFIIGDQLSQDTHCCRKKINSGGAGRIHRSCFTSFSSATTIPSTDDGNCQYVPKTILDTLCRNVWLWESQDEEAGRIRQELMEENLHQYNRRTALAQQKILETTIRVRSQLSRDIIEKVFSVYPVKNAWSEVSFGSNKDGIHRATLDDPMHYHSSGLCSYILEIAFKGLLPKEAKKIETYLREDFKTRSSIRYNFPRGKFNKGFTNCTLLTASEKVGLVYSLYLSLDTNRVKRIYERSILRQQTKYCDMSCFSSSSLPICKFDDKFFFKKSSLDEDHSCEMPRELSDVESMTKDLERLGLLKPMLNLLPKFDCLQTEYLLQACYNRVTSKTTKETNPLKIHDRLWPECAIDSEETMDRITTHLHSTLRQNNIPCPRELMNRIPGTKVCAEIQKHWLDKPVVKGTGNTSAILTDIEGFRKVLENVLLFHSLVHEFHQLSADFHSKEALIKLQGRLYKMLDKVFTSIYRGDNGVDVQTCKCHAHLHIVQDILLFGSPMGFEASKGERNLKIWAKGYSKTARKCGQNIFIEQTARRVADHMVLQQANQFLNNHDGSTAAQQAGRNNQNSASPSNQSLPPRWKYTRKKPHLVYDLATKETCTQEGAVVDCGLLLTDDIRKLLQRQHGRVGEICIWREIQIDLGDGNGHNHVRAYHEYDQYGSFFDWAAIDYSPQDAPNDDDYRPALVLLLYMVKSANTHHAIIWETQEASESEFITESNLVASWSMAVKHGGTACIRSIETGKIKTCISVYKHWRNPTSIVYHPLNDINPQEARAGLMIKEQYEIYAWLVNLVDDTRWVVEEEGDAIQERNDPVSHQAEGREEVTAPQPVMGEGATPVRRSRRVCRQNK